MNVKEKLLELRKENNLTQDEMAEKLMVSRQAISRWENGETVPSIDTFIIISKTFGASIDYLLGQLACQSCGMPIQKYEDLGTEDSGEVSVDYCCHCYKKGSFTSWTKNMTVQDMIESDIKFCLEHGIHKTPEEARKASEESIPKLKRWANI